MNVPRLSERMRQRLLSLLKSDRPDAEQWMKRLREIRTLEDIRACAETLRLLTHLDLPEVDAERVLLEILKHRDTMAGALGRDPGLRVAAVDYLCNVEHRLANPKIVEMSEFERTVRSAATDPLTRIYNRRFFEEALDREVRRSRRYGLRLSVVMLDLDDFKRVNDAHGHLFGDLVLQHVARLVRRAIREADVACRYGGEEFAVILPETDRLGAHAVAMRTRGRVESAFRDEPVAGRHVALTLSGGIGTYPDDGQEPHLLVRRADEALYLAKRSGKNRITVYYRERRRCVRYPAHPSATVRIESSDEKTSQSASALNLSRSGVLLETVESYRPSESVRLMLGRGGPASRSPEWAVNGRVVRIVPAPEVSGCFHVGIDFEEPVPEECFVGQICGARQPLRAARGGVR